MRPNKFGTRDDIEDSPTIIKKKKEKSVDTNESIRKEMGLDRETNSELNIETKNLITKQDAEKLIEQAVLKANEAAYEKINAVKKSQEEDDNAPMFSNKTVKELQQVAGVMNALKEFSANPLQKAIESKVGDVAAGVVERAFSPPQGEQKRDFLDQLLNSQLAAAFGAGLGQRGPEVVDSLTKNFGKDKAYDLMSGAIAGRGGVGGTNGLGGLGGTGGVGIPGTIPPGGRGKQEERDLILALDPNNPEHVTAYAASQADVPLDVARKMLLVHQDAFIKEMELNGVDTTQLRLSKNQQMMGSLPTDLYNSSNVNVREYKAPRVNDDIMKNTPLDEDKKWDKDTDDYVKSLEQESVDNPLERAEPKVEPSSVVNNTETNSQDNELVSYIKNMNEYIVGLKETVEKQNSDMFVLRQEIESIKQSSMGSVLMPDDRPRTIVEEFDANSGIKQPTGVKPIKSIKKGSCKEDNKGGIT